MTSKKDLASTLVEEDPAQTQPPTPILLQQEPIPNADLPDSQIPDAGAQRYLRNIGYARALELAAQIDYVPGQVASKTLVQTPALGLTLFAMAKGEGISAHKSGGDAFVIVLDGRCEITIDAEKTVLKQGQCIVMPAGHPHAVQATDNLKMLLIVVFPHA